MLSESESSRCCKRGHLAGAFKGFSEFRCSVLFSHHLVTLSSFKNLDVMVITKKSSSTIHPEHVLQRNNGAELSCCSAVWYRNCTVYKTLLQILRKEFISSTTPILSFFLCTTHCFFNVCTRSMVFVPSWCTCVICLFPDCL